MRCFSSRDCWTNKIHKPAGDMAGVANASHRLCSEAPWIHPNTRRPDTPCRTQEPSAPRNIQNWEVRPGRKTLGEGRLEGGCVPPRHFPENTADGGKVGQSNAFKEISQGRISKPFWQKERQTVKRTKGWKKRDGGWGQRQKVVGRIAALAPYSRAHRCSHY